MKFSNTWSFEKLQVISRFRSFRKILMSDEYANHLGKPLAYWALPTDRGLPLAFLGRTLKDLLDTPFLELSNTPGIGQKKVHSFVKLLARAANTDPSELPTKVINPLKNRVSAEPEPKAASAGGNGFNLVSEPETASVGGNGLDPVSVSEVVWSQWRASIRKHGLGKETLGRLAPSLRNITRVIWNTPMHVYADYTLAEIRALKTHGEKRVRAILEVFHGVYTLVANMGTRDHLVVKIVPRSINTAEQWIGKALQSTGVPSEEEIFEHFVGPLLEQVRIDTTEQITALAEDRLGTGGPITSVRQAARATGLTRARVYQLLNEINDIMVVRWPIGRHQVYELREKIQSELAQMKNPPELRQFFAAVELFYPGSRRGAAGPLDLVPLADEEKSPEDRENRMVQAEVMV